MLALTAGRALEEVGRVGWRLAGVSGRAGAWRGGTRSGFGSGSGSGSVPGDGERWLSAFSSARGVGRTASPAMYVCARAERAEFGFFFFSLSFLLITAARADLPGARAGRRDGVGRRAGEARGGALSAPAHAAAWWSRSRPVICPCSCPRG